MTTSVTDISVWAKSHFFKISSNFFTTIAHLASFIIYPSSSDDATDQKLIEKENKMKVLKIIHMFKL